MNGNGHITFERLKVLIQTAMDGVVNFDGQINVEDVVRYLEEQLDSASIQDILTLTERENLTQVVLMFV